MKKEKLKSNDLLLIFVIMAMIVIGLTIVFRLPYYAADDYLMNYIANGSLGDYTNLIYPNVAVGLILRVLYQIMPKLNWYFIIWQFIIVLSLTLGLKIILYFKNRLALILYIGLCACLPFFLSFTVVGYCAVGCASAYIFFLLDVDCIEKRKYILPIVLVIVGTLVREATLISALTLFLPIIVYKLYHNKMRRYETFWTIGGAIFLLGGLTFSMMFADRVVELIVCMILILAGWFLSLKGLEEFSRLFWSFMIIFIIITGFNMAQIIVEKQTNWDSFREYTIARSAVIDYPHVDYKEIETELKAIGVAEADYDILWQWTFLDKETFSTENLQEMQQIISQHMPFQTSLKSALQLLFTKEVAAFYLLSFVSAIILLISGRKNKKTYLFLMISLAILWLLYFSLVYQHRFKLYVAMPLLVVFVLQMSLIVGSDIDDTVAKKAKTIMSGGMTLVFAVVVLAGGYRSLQISKEKSLAASPIMDEIAGQSQENVYIVQSYVYNQIYDYAGYAAYKLKKTDIFDHLIKTGSGDTFSPRYYKQVKDCGIASPDRLLIQLTKSDNLFYIGNNGDFILSYLEKKLNRSISMKKEKIFENGVAIINFS